VVLGEAVYPVHILKHESGSVLAESGGEIYMDDRNLWMPEQQTSRSTSFGKREVVAAVFRHKRLAIACCVAIILGAVLAGLLLPKYEARMKLLVKRERIDPIVAPEQGTQVQVQSNVSEEEMNSEAELLKADDVLRKVVVTNGLQAHEGGLVRSGSEEEKIAAAVRHLRSKLSIDPGRKTSLITVSYESRDPQLAAAVLRSLGDAYLEKHMEVNRPHGQLAFFEKQAADTKQGLSQAEQKLGQFAKQNGTVAPQIERDITLQKLSEFKFSLEQTRASIRETENRIAELTRLQASTPDRITTRSSRSDNPQLLQQLKSTLLNLELKRTELLTKFQPTYRAVQEVDKQIADTKASIAAEDAKPVREEVTDQNPTHEWIRSDLAKAKADLTSLQARERVTQGSIKEYENRAQSLEAAGLQQQDLLRTQKEQQDNYLLYARKREEARITEALDQGKILNVAIAEKATPPALPAHPAWFYAMFGAFAGLIFSAGLVFIAEYSDSSFRTPDELNSDLGLPVLASIPREPNPISTTSYNAITPRFDDDINLHQGQG
jgi:uncharacterized protein involved in exopolysaccharide biosynthesis